VASIVVGAIALPYLEPGPVRVTVRCKMVIEIVVERVVERVVEKMGRGKMARRGKTNQEEER
jgi:hypothetical protein